MDTWEINRMAKKITTIWSLTGKKGKCKEKSADGYKAV